MKEITGWFKAWGSVEVDDNATEEEMRKALAKHLGFEHFTMLNPEDITLEEEPNNEQL